MNTVVFPPASAGSGITGAQVPTYEINYTEVAAYADLPAANTQANEVYIVRQDSGTWLLGTKKKSGLYYSDGVSWSFMGNNVSLDDTTASNESVYSSSKVEALIGAVSGGGTTDHGLLTGLTDDDHAQYHTDARGDARYKSLLVEYEVTGSAATSINFSGLDISANKSYAIEIELINPTASNASLYIYVNGDTTAANYTSQVISAISTTISGTAAATPAVGGVLANSTSLITIKCAMVGGYASFKGNSTFARSSTIRIYDHSMVYNTAVANITQLTIASSIANVIGVNSKIRIYRGDT